MAECDQCDTRGRCQAVVVAQFLTEPLQPFVERGDRLARHRLRGVENESEQQLRAVLSRLRSRPRFWAEFGPGGPRGGPVVADRRVRRPVISRLRPFDGWFEPLSQRGGGCPKHPLQSVEELTDLRAPGTLA